MRRPAYSGQFKRDVKQAQKRGKDMDKLKALLGLLEGRVFAVSPTRRGETTRLISARKANERDQAL